MWPVLRVLWWGAFLLKLLISFFRIWIIWWTGWMKIRVNGLRCVECHRMLTLNLRTERDKITSGSLITAWKLREVNQVFAKSKESKDSDVMKIIWVKDDGDTKLSWTDDSQGARLSVDSWRAQDQPEARCRKRFLTPFWSRWRRSSQAWCRPHRPLEWCPVE